MTTFRYEAARQDGARIRGVLDAATIPDAAGVLSARGLYPLTVEISLATGAWWNAWHRPSARAQATLFQSLASLVEAGVPLHQALVATERVVQGSLRQAIGRVATRVHEGASLGRALAAECDAFAAIAIGLVRAGERGAGLTAALNQAGAHQEREAETAARIRSALAYPLLLATVGSASVALITLFVVPRFAALLGDLGQSLPPATRVLIAVSHFVRHYGILLGALVVGLAVGVTRVIIEHRSAWHAWLLRLPLIGPIRHALATARATRTLGALLGTGTSALTALDIARDAVGDAAIARRLLEAKSRVAEGSGLARAFEDTRALTPTALQLAAIGDQAGRLPTMLAKAAEMEEQEAERRLKTLVSFIEPALILVFAGLVAFVAAALLQAVYSLRPGGA